MPYLSLFPAGKTHKTGGIVCSSNCDGCDGHTNGPRQASSDDIWLADVNAVLDESHRSNARVPQSFSTSADPNKSFEFCPHHQTVPLERSFIIVKSEKLIRLSSSVRWTDFWSGCSCVGLRSYRDKKHLNYHTLFLIFHRQLDLSMHIATASCAIISKQINWAPGSVN